ncbi:leucine-rich repeat domain-containing protein [uncultured Prevotella sp.]|uniref:leucine-rich repeat domain-containing protein n=2 Tax=uncultured Prevotella sp. TaxID=159272 RepID=UPI00260FFCAD|nr:leucine-rich repeat domain-containing protein [uncultured Prevotella sp.]
MRKILSALALALLNVLPSSSQTIKKVDMKFSDDLSVLLGDDKYETDSLIITGELPHTAFAVIKDCVKQGRLSGINLGDCRVENDSIPDEGLMVGMGAHMADTHTIKGLTLPKTLRAVGVHSVAHLHVHSLELPSTLRVIGAQAFEYNQYVGGTLTIPEGVEEIGSSAFHNCVSLTDIIFPSSLRKIDRSAFSGTSNLQRLELNEGLETIGDLAFERSGWAFKEIRIPASVTHLGEGAFYYGRELDRLEFAGEVTSIPSYCFCLSKAKEIVWPKNLESLGEHSFDDYDGEVLALPDGLRTISNNVFETLTGVSTLILPESLCKVSENVFTSAHKLKAVYAKGSIPPELPVNSTYGDGGWFVDIPEDAVLYVPVGSYTVYRNCAMFGNFKTIKETTDFPSGIDGVESAENQSSGNGNVYTLDGRRIATGAGISSLPHGMYIVNGKKVVK